VKAREITVVFYGRRFVRGDWRYDVDEAAVAEFFAGLEPEFQRYGIELTWQTDESIALEIRGYGDLLNTVRLRAPGDGIGNLCLGHVIGASANTNFIEDLRRGINRIAFAPETIAPEEHNRRVCHNCGCGC
jgi:hypothetical protein